MSSETLTFTEQLAHAHATVPDALPGAAFCALADGILALLFPQRAERPLPSADAVAAELHHFRAELAVLLNQVPNLPAPPSVLANEFAPSCRPCAPPCSAMPVRFWPATPPRRAWAKS